MPFFLFMLTKLIKLTQPKKKKKDLGGERMNKANKNQKARVSSYYPNYISF